MINKMLDFIFPTSSQCHFCSRRAAPNPYHLQICSLCLSQIHFIQNPICHICGRPWNNQYAICPDCHRRNQHDQTYFNFNRSAVSYNTKMKEVISLYKFRGDERLASILTQLLYHAYKGFYQGDNGQKENSQEKNLQIDLITYVPLHPQRLMERGFNQSEQLANQLGKRLKIPVIETLTRLQNTDKQSKKGRHDRLQRLDHTFQLIAQSHPLTDQSPNSNNNPNIITSYKNILLIDDIYTTGRTANMCSKILAAKGAKVYVLTIAR